ncbi:MAG: bifunctional hydroxymethylpyrimidine kinase/phosphomethylpyrimidine kinase, partial [Clostridia bacterium]|nr:bifunctional hydroxymethylpyrimidine kinase/phosphomethylpyrimidine kinase [Clostridia bacterium]
DVLTPNLTEALILIEEDYDSFEITEENLKVVCEKLQKLGAKNIVLTGAPFGDMLYTSVLDENGGFEIIKQKKLPTNMHGTGDTFTSVLCGKMLNGISLIESAKIATDFVSYAMEYSYGVEDFIVRGVVFEPVLHKLRP